MNRKLLTRAAVAAALAGTIGGCADDYPPFVRLEALRVLAIQSDPVAPALGETTTLTPLVYVPAGQTPSYAWSWCPIAGSANEGYPCAVPEQALRALLPPSVMVPAYDLGTSPTASFPLTFDPKFLRSLCKVDDARAAADDADAGVPADDAAVNIGGGDQLPLELDCRLGFPIQIKLVVKTGNDEVEAVRTLHLRLDLDVPGNVNPRINGLAATFLLDKADPTKGTFDVAFDELGSVVLPRQTSTLIKALVTAEQAELWKDKDRDPKASTPVPVSCPFAPIEAQCTQERLFLTWFVESGKTSDEITSYIQDRVPLENALKSKWTPGSVGKYPSTSSRLYVVIRDNRGGISWATGVATLAVPE